MPRPTQIRFFSPDDPRLKEHCDPITLIPEPVVRGIIRGLLNHLWTEKRRKPNEEGIPQERVERRLMTLVEFAARDRLAKGVESDELLLQETAKWVPQLFQDLTGHTYFVLNADSDLILKELTPYEDLPGQEQREQWLQKALPRLIASLKQGTVCTATDCTGKAHTPLPSKVMLFKWACTRNVGALRDSILGHFHGLDASTVKRTRSDPPQ